MTGRLRAVLELLRAPLLLSPIADVSAGFALACAGDATWNVTGEASLAWPFSHEDSRHLALAAATGCCLLAAGMTLNGIVDLPEDRRTKPQRPLPRGTLSLPFARNLYVALTLLGLSGAALLAARPSREAAPLVGLFIVAVTLIYHVGVKRLRVPGCLLLGAARGLDLLLGAVALLGRVTPGALLAAGLYALYMTGASLHASTDDEPGSSRWSALGLLACVAALLLPPLRIGARLADGDPAAWLGAAVALLGAARMIRAARTRPPPAVTGVALSGLYVLLATLVLCAGLPATRLPVAALVLALFALSRLLFRAFPPT
jgi:4-hydroxybenzoate polyprenyltransferase